MSRVLIFDPLSEKGHREFNNSFDKLFLKFEREWIVSKDMHDSMHINCSKNHFDNKLINKKNKFFYLFNQVFLLIKFIIYSRKYDKAILVSYYLPSVFLLSVIFSLSKEKYFFVEHNTIPESSRIKDIMFRFLTCKITHICLAPYIGKYLTKKYRKRTISIWHPFPESQPQVEKNENLFFMPSSTITDNDRNKILDRFFCESTSLLYLKGERQGETSKNIIFQKFFNDYNDLMARSKFVIIPQKFSYRVSGVFFEAISNNCIVLMSKCEFSNSMAAVFDKNVFIVDDWNVFDLSYAKEIPVDFNNDSVYKIEKIHLNSIKVIYDEFKC